MKRECGVVNSEISRPLGHSSAGLVELRDWAAIGAGGSALEPELGHKVEAVAVF